MHGKRQRTAALQDADARFGSAWIAGSLLDFASPLARYVLVWLWRRPLLLILLAHTVFSIGIWNARDGYGEETGYVEAAYRVLNLHEHNPSIYNNLLALLLRHVTPDPVAALTLVKYFSSLLATVALYIALSCFSGGIRQSAIVFACFVWIASSLDAPYVQSTSLSLFSFAVMLIGVDCRFLSETVWGVFGFYFFGLLAASLHPEYYMPVVLLTVIWGARFVWSGSIKLETRVGLLRYWTRGGAVFVAVAGAATFWSHPPAPVLKIGKHLDTYALAGLGQCYADYYHGRHPGVVFSPMTEYRELLDRTFNKPAGFCDAVNNNPSEALRYFAVNGARNLLWYGPGALMDRYREQTARRHHGVLYWAVRVILLSGAVASARFLYRARWKCETLCVGPGPAAWYSTRRKLFILAVLASTAFVAMLLLVGTSRYYLCWAPLFYLGVAYCADSLMRAFNFFRYEAQLIGLSFLIFCSPNYLTSRPNYEFDAIRQVAARVKEHPTIAAWWAEPDTVLALRENATPISIPEGIHQADIESGRIDILLIDQGFRESKTWAEQRDFFQRFEREPESWGFRKATDIPTGKLDIYYRPNSARASLRSGKSLFDGEIPGLTSGLR
jgi:hypothetical protein